MPPIDPRAPIDLTIPKTAPPTITDMQAIYPYIKSGLETLNAWLAHLESVSVTGGIADQPVVATPVTLPTPTPTLGAEPVVVAPAPVTPVGPVVTEIDAHHHASVRRRLMAEVQQLHEAVETAVSTGIPVRPLVPMPAAPPTTPPPAPVVEASPVPVPTAAAPVTGVEAPVPPVIPGASVPEPPPGTRAATAA